MTPEELIATIPKRKNKGVKPALGVGIEYNASLQRIIKEVKKDIDSQLVPLLRKLSPEYSADSAIVVHDAWFPQIEAMLQQILAKWSSPLFRSLADRIARAFVKSADNVHGKRFGIDIFGDDAELQEYLAASAYDNARLIKSIPEQYLGQVESIVMTNVRAGNRSNAIVKSLQEQFGVTERRAKFIARDQVAKINGDLSSKRQQLAGFSYFKWLDSDDSRVRDRHESIANRVTAYGRGIYRWDNPPLSDKGVPIIPGSDYQCRCVSIPVTDAEVKENQRKGLTNPSVKR